MRRQPILKGLVVVLLVLLIFVGGVGLGSCEKRQAICFACKNDIGQDYYCIGCYTDMVDIAEAHPVIEEEYVFSGGGVPGY